MYSYEMCAVEISWPPFLPNWLKEGHFDRRYVNGMRNRESFYTFTNYILSFFQSLNTEIVLLHPVTSLVTYSKEYNFPLNNDYKKN